MAVTPALNRAGQAGRPNAPTRRTPMVDATGHLVVAEASTRLALPRSVQHALDHLSDVATGSTSTLSVGTATPLDPVDGRRRRRERLVERLPKAIPMHRRATAQDVARWSLGRLRRRRLHDRQRCRSVAACRWPGRHGLVATRIQVSPGQSQNRPIGETVNRSSRASATKASSSTPNWCGAANDDDRYPSMTPSTSRTMSPRPGRTACGTSRNGCGRWPPRRAR